MDIQILKKQIIAGPLEVDALLFLPRKSEKPFTHAALFTHGYTSHKSVLVPWASKLVEQKIPTMIFDLPGHFLGSFREIDSFESFKEFAPQLFESARLELNKNAQNDIPSYFIGGHSLGALISLLGLNYLKAQEKMAIAVGFGAPPKNVTHIFDTPFFKKTMEIRSQLVDKNLNPETILPWIRDQKNSNLIRNHRIHLISGQDDVIVGKTGLGRLREHLERMGNTISVDEPKNLPHHQPESASTHVNHFVRNYLKSL